MATDVTRGKKRGMWLQYLQLTLAEENKTKQNKIQLFPGQENCLPTGRQSQSVPTQLATGRREQGQ